jgi:cytochrome d ubiquinol oxidase subunit I
VTAVYAVLTVATVYVLRRMTRSTPVPDAPQDGDVDAFKVV